MSKSLNNLPLIDLTNEYLKIISSPKDIASLTLEEFLALKQSPEPKRFFPLGENTSEITALVNKFAEDFNLKKEVEWFIPQGLSKFVDVPVYQLLAALPKDKLLGSLWLLFKYCTRGLLVPKQIDARYVNYSSLVPLIPSAYKKFHDKAYSSWDRGTFKTLVPTDLYQAATAEYPDIDARTLLAARTEALTIKTTKNIRNAETTYALYFPKDSELHKLPKLAQIMLCQTWCAHPVNRSRYMILDPRDWDKMPESLISGAEPFVKTGFKFANAELL